MYKLSLISITALLLSSCSYNHEIPNHDDNGLHKSNLPHYHHKLKDIDHSQNKKGNHQPGILKRLSKVFEDKKDIKEKNNSDDGEKNSPHIANEIRHIKPLELTKKNIRKKVIYHSYNENSSPVIYKEYEGDKIVINNYGYGNKTWSAAPGAAKYTVNLINNDITKTELNKKTPIAILGNGALGLFTAYELIERGYNNVTIIAHQNNHQKSHLDETVILPIKIENNEKLQRLLNNIYVESYKEYNLIALGKNHKLTSGGARKMPIYINKQNPDLEMLASNSVPSKEVTLDFGNNTQRVMYAYDEGIFVDSANMVNFLNGYLKGRVKYKIQNITNINQIKQNIVFNCSGFDMDHINEPEKLPDTYFVLLSNQQPAELQYVIDVDFGDNYHDDLQTLSISPKKDVNVLHPLDIGAIGGKFSHKTRKSISDEQKFDIIFNNAKKFYGIK